MIGDKYPPLTAEGTVFYCGGCDRYFDVEADDRPTLCPACGSAYFDDDYDYDDDEPAEAPRACHARPWDRQADGVRRHRARRRGSRGRRAFGECDGA